MRMPWSSRTVENEQPQRGALAIAASTVRNTIISLDELAQSAISLIYTGEEYISTIGYTDVIPYFIERRPTKAITLKGLLTINQNDDGGSRLTQCFLDDSNQVVSDGTGLAIGRTIRFDHMAPDLAKIFAGKTTVILS